MRTETTENDVKESSECGQTQDCCQQQDLNETGEQLSSCERTRHAQVFRPSVDIVEQADGLVLRADMPGTSSDDLDIQFENGTLTIRGRVKPRRPEQGQSLWREYGVGDFQRTFQVSEQIDGSRISASYREGILTLTLPKIEAVRPRKITVNAN